MLTSTLVTTNALDIVLPSSSAQPLKQQTLSISITEDLRYFINNEAVERTFWNLKCKKNLIQLMTQQLFYEQLRVFQWNMLWK